MGMAHSGPAPQGAPESLPPYAPPPPYGYPVPPSHGWVAAAPPVPRDPRTAVQWMRILGFLLLFVGVLVAVSLASANGTCYAGSTSCTGSTLTNYLSGAANGVLVGKLLFTVGLFFLGASSGLMIQWLYQRPHSSPETSDEAKLTRRALYGNGIMAFLVILLFLYLLLSVGVPAP